MSNCSGCGIALEPTQDEVNSTVDSVLTASIKDARKHGEICPLCGHSQAQPVSHRKSVQFALLFAALALGSALAVEFVLHRNTERQAAAQDALKQIQSSPVIEQLLGQPLSIDGGVTGDVRQDETGWHEVTLNIPLRGPRGKGIAHVSGGRGTADWKFSTLEVVMPQLQKKADLITGKVVLYEPDAYVDTHT